MVGTGLHNLARFVAATAGRRGRTADVAGGVAVASPVPVANGYVNAAFRTAGDVSASEFERAVRRFFAEVGHPYVVWAPRDEEGLADTLRAAGGAADGTDSPMMVVTRPLPLPSGLRVRSVATTEDREVFGRLCESGYGEAGLAWLLDHHESYDVPGATWAIVADDTGDLGVGCGFADRSTGGIYYVATPPGRRGRGAAGAVTAWLTNHLLAAGVTEVTLQASTAGLPVYERLGFVTVGTYGRFTFPSP